VRLRPVTVLIGFSKRGPPRHTRLGALEDAVSIDADLAKGIRKTASVAHQPAG
jgi:hypothetical protein